MKKLFIAIILAMLLAALLIMLWADLTHAGNYKDHGAIDTAVTRVGGQPNDEDTLDSLTVYDKYVTPLHIFDGEPNDSVYVEMIIEGLFSYRTTGIYRATQIKRTVIDSIPTATLGWELVEDDLDAQYRQVPKLVWEYVYKADTTWKKVWPDTVEAVPLGLSGMYWKMTDDTLKLHGDGK